jgi:hypothetical protein
MADGSMADGRIDEFIDSAIGHTYASKPRG